MYGPEPPQGYAAQSNLPQHRQHASQPEKHVAPLSAPESSSGAATIQHCHASPPPGTRDCHRESQGSRPRAFVYRECSAAQTRRILGLSNLQKLLPTSVFVKLVKDDPDGLLRQPIQPRMCGNR